MDAISLKFLPWEFCCSEDGDCFFIKQWEGKTVARVTVPEGDFIKCQDGSQMALTDDDEFVIIPSNFL